MRLAALFTVLSIPLFVIAQQSSASGGGNSAQVSTILSTSVGVDGNHQQTTQIITSLVTLTSSAAGSQQTNSTSNSTNSGNSTSSSNSTSNSTSSSTHSPLPTATQSVDGGGNGPNGAPSPGASSDSGIYGPDDSYISGAFGLSASTIVSISVGLIGGACLVWT